MFVMEGEYVSWKANLWKVNLCCRRRVCAVEGEFVPWKKYVYRRLICIVEDEYVPWKWIGAGEGSMHCKRQMCFP